MHLYHVLSRKRLDQKLAYAETNSGRLLLTGHAPAQDSASGALPTYIHLLSNLVGGMDFSRRDEVAAIRVTLRPDVHVARLVGPRASIDLAEAARHAPVIHVTWDEPGLRFQEWLLTDDDAVAEWTADPALLAQDFARQLDLLGRGGIDGASFFYPDMDPHTQRGMAELIGWRLGLHQRVPDHDRVRAAYTEACHRLGLARMNATKNLFFVGAPFLDLAARLAKEDWLPDRPLAHVRVQTPWHALDEALTTAAQQLGSALDDAACGPLEVGFVDPDLVREPEGHADVFVGARMSEEDAAGSGLRLEPPLGAAEESPYQGPLWDLEDVVTELTEGRGTLGTLRYVLHAFHGARSERNRVRVVVA